MDKLNDRARDRLRIPATVSGGIGTAVLALLMVSVVTFGANAIRPATADRAANAADASDANDATAAHERGDRAALGHGDRDGDAPKQEQPEQDPKVIDSMDGDEGDEHPWQPRDDAKDEPKDEPKPTDKPDATEPPKDEPKDEPKPTDKPKPDPTKPPQETTTLGLEAWVKEGKVKLGWSKYLGEGFEYYKLARSTDEKVLWPMGGNDTLLAAIGDPYTPYWADAAPCGTKLFYRVFAVRHAEEGYKVLAASNVADAFVECHEDEPSDEPAEPVTLGLDVWVTDAGDVKLAWEKCTSEDFAAYKVVRSAVHENPTFPVNEGTELVAAIGDRYATAFKDTNVEPGQTWTYRVYAMAHGSDGWVVLGHSAARTITVE